MKQNIIQLADAGSSCHKNIEQWTIDGMPQLIRDAGASMGPGANVMVLACRWRYFAAEDLMGLKKLASNFDYRVVKMPCSGQVQADWVSTALDSGADAVLIMGGHPATCHYAQDRIEGDQLLEATSGLQQFDPARLLVDWSEGDRSERFLGSVDQLIATMGNNRDISQ
jgi:F420-non-reducing hydrogenase iron-sulfur subunit